MPIHFFPAFVPLSTAGLVILLVISFTLTNYFMYEVTIIPQFIENRPANPTTVNNNRGWLITKKVFMQQFSSEDIRIVTPAFYLEASRILAFLEETNTFITTHTCIAHDKRGVFVRDLFPSFLLQCY